MYQNTKIMTNKGRYIVTSSGKIRPDGRDLNLTRSMIDDKPYVNLYNPNKRLYIRRQVKDVVAYAFLPQLKRCEVFYIGESVKNCSIYNIGFKQVNGDLFSVDDLLSMSYSRFIRMNFVKRKRKWRA